MTTTTTTRGRPETGAPTTHDQRAAARTRWSADADRSSVDFAVKSFWGLLTVRGHFDRFSGSYEVGPDGSRIELTIDADSLDTGNAKRDEHLRATDFFAVAEHPQVRFASTRVRESGDGTLRVEGDLHAAGKVVALDLDATVAQLDDGRLEIEATTTVDQRSLGMSERPAGHDPPAGDGARHGTPERRGRERTIVTGRARVAIVGGGFGDRRGSDPHRRSSNARWRPLRRCPRPARLLATPAPLAAPDLSGAVFCAPHRLAR